jgi:hypothetical protein
MALQYEPPRIVMEYKRNGKLYHHTMPVSLPPSQMRASPSSRDKALDEVSGELQLAHTKYLQEISEEQVRLFVAQLLDFHQTANVESTGKFKEADRVEVYWPKQNKWYAGVVVRVREPCAYSIDYDDGDKEANVDESRIRVEVTRSKRTRVTFATKIVAVVTTRPKTAPQDKNKLFYSGDDMVRG